MPKNSVFLKDYSSPFFSIERVFLNFELDEDHTLVTNTMILTRLKEGSLVLFGDNLTLERIVLDGKSLQENEYKHVGSNLQLDNVPAETFTLEIVTKIHPETNTALSGLYKSNDLFCTQCEAEGFRRITYFLDRPDVLTRFTTRIFADKARYPVLLSNGNLKAQGDATNNRHFVVWEDPFKKPCYLFALVAGTLAYVEDTFITMSGRTIILRIYVEPGHEHLCGHAMTSLKKSMKWDEEVYGREYDLDMFMIVAVSDFNMGAMENKGLNIFNAKYILADPETATDQDYADVEGVVAHEYFHNWTGNRVTCRDWFQLSLKEGLTVFRDQEFSGDMNARDVFRITDVKALRQHQFPEDASKMAHPVRPESYEEINNFYTATIYNKGAEVIRMQYQILGKEGFRKGMDVYFDKFDGKAVTIDDFVASMETGNNVDLTQFKRWYSQAGTPEVNVLESYENGVFTFTLTQSCPQTPEGHKKEPFYMPLKMAFFDKSGKYLSQYPEKIILKDAQETFSFSGFSERPVFSLNREFSAPIKLIRQLSDEDLRLLMRFETDGFAKWDAGIQLALSVMQSWKDKDKSTWQIPKEVLNAYLAILTDDKLDSALKAELLTPPSFEDVASLMTLIDVDWVEDVRKQYRILMAEALKPALEATWLELSTQTTSSMTAEASACRRLANVCLALLMSLEEQKYADWAWMHQKNAKNMTDQLAGFTLLTHYNGHSHHDEAINTFYERWKNHEVVLDKWFSIQATADVPSILEKIQKLLKHKAFSWTNPNKVRSVVGAFIQANPRHFHALDGSGYQLLEDTLLRLDAINPQIAARLATPLTRWQRFDLPRQTLMVNMLKRLKTHPLSADLTEVVNKSLVKG